MPFKRARVLLIEDDPDDVLFVSQALSRPGDDLMCDLESASSLAGGLKMLQSGGYQAVLLDLTLPDSRGLATFLMVRAARPDLPVVVFSGLADQALALEAVRLGAQDYLTKGDFDSKLLRRAVLYSIERGTLVSSLEQVIDKAVDGMAVVDARGVVRYLNLAAEAVFGREAEELLGRPFPLPFSPDAPSVAAVVRPDGVERSVEVRATAIEWKKESAWLASLRDLTDLKNLERLRSEARERRLAEQAREQVLGAVSHDLKDPLSVIEAAVDNLEDGLAGPVTPEQREILDTIRRQVLRAARTVSEWLDFRASGRPR